MSIYSVNKPNRTLTIHKNNCNQISKEIVGCGCGKTGKNGNHQWWCEEHIKKEDIDRFMGDRFWAILICNKCF